MTTPMSVVEAELFIGAEPARIAAVLADPAWQAGWARGLTLHPYEDRGDEGLRAVVTGVFTGSCEWWIEPVPAPPGTSGRGREAWTGSCRGAVVHFWLRPVAPPGWWHAGLWSRRRVELHRRGLARRWRTAMFRLKDTLELPRPPSAGGG